MQEEWALQMPLDMLRYVRQIELRFQDKLWLCFEDLLKNNISRYITTPE
jgi:hypothetical protein